MLLFIYSLKYKVKYLKVGYNPIVNDKSNVYKDLQKNCS